MAHSLKRRGSILVEVALVIPLTVLFFLFLLQYSQMIQASWFVDQGAEAACRAALVQEEAHPDPEVAATLALAPITGTRVLRQVPGISNDHFFSKAARYGAAILKTQATANKDGQKTSSQIEYAFELKIPIINHLIQPILNPIEWAKQKIFKENPPSDLASHWSLVSGVPHLQMTKTLEMTD